jgi:nicotinamidase-related amidase
MESRLRSKADDAVLIVVDMQEKLLPAMHGADGVARKAETLIRGCLLLGIPVIFTQQYTKGLGETIPSLKDAYTEAASAYAAGAGYDVAPGAANCAQTAFSYIEKTSFSAVDEPAFVKALDCTERSETILCGVESHVCVMQTAEDLYGRGHIVRIAADAAASRKTADSDLAYSRMAQEGMTVTTTEALLFDFMKSSKHPAFRSISELVKA